MPPTAAFKALTAAWLYGFEVVGIEPIEVINPHSAGIAARAGLSVSRAAIDSEDLAIVRGFRVTTIERTIADLSAQLPIEEAVVIADIALHRGLTTIEALRQKARCRRRMPGVRRFREVIDLANGAAESPMETRLRLLFKSRQLPEPWLQERLVDEKGRAIGRVDFYFPQARLVVEYDGEGHRERMVEDLRRQNRLLNAGYLLLRFTAPDVVRHPDLVVEQVRAALASRRR